MPRAIPLLFSLTVRLEAYAFFIIVPLIVFLVAVSSESRGFDGIHVIRGALISGPLMFGLGFLFRALRLRPVMAFLAGKNAGEGVVRDGSAIRKILLTHPVWEATAVAFRWVVGLSIAAFYIWCCTGVLGSIEYLLTMLVAIPSNFAIFYFATENILSRLLMDERFGGAPREPSDRRVFGLFGRALLTLVSTVMIPTVVFGYLFYLSQEGHVTILHASMHIIFIILLSSLAIIVIAYESSVSMHLAVRQVVGALEILRKGDIDIRIPMVSRGEIGIIGRHVNCLADSLDEYMKRNRDLTKNLESKVTRRTEELNSAMEELTAANEHLREARDELWGEIELAKRIQSVLLPAYPRIAGYDVAVRMDPAAHVGGDYYDVINGTGIDWVVIGDVSGHGMTAGLVMMMVQTAIHATLKINPSIRPVGLFEAVNEVIFENTRLFSEEKYMTLTAISVGRDGEMCYAGPHEDILVYRAASGSVEVHETDGLWIGMYEDIRGRVGGARLDLAPEDVMLLFTDGVVNAWTRNSVAGRRRPESDSFGQERLMEALRRTGGVSAAKILEEIVGLLDGYRCEDDATLVVIKRVP
ncbi:MAG: hypothetical protein E4G96_06290 [Chrysiogenales bacterium]|nr:MAG: hypothetical protein E4G96_06290 [Chrysiogenales bacterium]